MKFVTWNVRDYLQPSCTADERARCARVPEVLESLDADVVALQEIMCDEHEYVRLAEQVGMHCRITHHGESRVVLDPGRRTRGMGLMWRPGIVPVPDSLVILDRSRLYCGMAAAQLVIQGVRMVVASTHFTPADLNLRYDEAVTVAIFLHRLGTHTIIGADWNCISGARTADGHYYDHDPYEHLDWRPAFLGKCRRNTHRHWADREPMNALEWGGLHDVAAAIDAPWHHTTGHWDTDSITQRIDAVRATPALTQTATGVWSIDTGLTRSISDHLPVVATFDLDHLTASEDGPHRA